jgi:tRNA/tmRNA/rRNA uracil-C5-methylase (TrmA/RlmC/RlmD family)
MKEIDVDSLGSCKLADRCSGCPWIGLDAEEQLVRKSRNLKADFVEHCGLSPVIHHFSQPVPYGRNHRDYAELTLHRVRGKTRIGLYDMNRNDIVDMRYCPLMSTPLHEWFMEVRGLMPSIQFGHFRIRVASDGARGLWLDFPKSVLNYFLGEQRFFKRIMERCTLEIGQKHLRVRDNGGVLEARTRVFAPWFETFTGPGGSAVPLYSTIAGFSQPGFHANRHLLTRLFRRLRFCSDVNGWVELGSGTGNFTIPLASSSPVLAVEMHPLAIDGLKKSFAESGLFHRIDIFQANFHQPSKALVLKLANAFSAGAGLLVDPPRSGLGTVLDHVTHMPERNQPGHILYFSCFSSSLARDADKLLKCGYELVHLEGIDQFPHSPHCEWLAHFQRV